MKNMKNDVLHAVCERNSFPTSGASPPKKRLFALKSTMDRNQQIIPIFDEIPYIGTHG